MRKILIANFKMNLTDIEIFDYFNIFLKNFKSKNNQIIFCVPYTSLYQNKSLKSKNVKIYAQNINENELGNFTGEISCSMIKNFNIKGVLLGHSERRILYFEDDNLINKKIKIALKNNLKIILCVGENLKQNNKRKIKKFLFNQLKKCLKDIDEKKLKNIIFAYEPVKSIGTGNVSTVKEIEFAVKVIKRTIEILYSKDYAEKIKIVYGGSINFNNYKEIKELKCINGILVGKASLNPKDFLKFI